MLSVLLVAASAAASGEARVPTCVPVVAEGSSWTQDPVNVVPGEPWCLQMATPGKGELHLWFHHGIGPVPRWVLELSADDGSPVGSFVLDEPDPRRARIRTRILVGAEHDHVVLTVVGAGSGFDLGLSFNPIPPTITALLLPDGSPAESVVRGQALVLTGQDFTDDPRTRVHAGGVRVPPDHVETDRLTFRVPARAYEDSLFVDGPSGTSNRMVLPLLDPDPGPAFGTPRLPTEGQVAVDVFVDPHWDTEALRRRVDTALTGCGLGTDWKVVGYSLMIHLHTIHLVVPPGQDSAAFGEAVIHCLAKALDVGVGGLVVGERPD